jgi:hypothetical protein
MSIDASAARPAVLRAYQKTPQLTSLPKADIGSGMIHVCFVPIALQNLSDFAAEPGFCVLVRRPRYELRAADGVTCCCRPARPHR